VFADAVDAQLSLLDVSSRKVAQSMKEAAKIWQNGALVDWADAQVHVLSHALHYGTSVFEGIRAYNTDRGPAVFRLDDHLARLERSAAMYYMPIPYTR
jgi:branched-chain amino acid aminotransferase